VTCILTQTPAAFAQDDVVVVDKIKVVHENRLRSFKIKPGKHICLTTIRDSTYIEGKVKSVGIDFIEITDDKYIPEDWTIPFNDIERFGLSTVTRVGFSLIGALVSAGSQSYGYGGATFGSWRYFFLQKEDNRWRLSPVLGTPDDYFEIE
jgi:hypothetical protein